MCGRSPRRRRLGRLPVPLQGVDELLVALERLLQRIVEGESLCHDRFVVHTLHERKHAWLHLLALVSQLHYNVVQDTLRVQRVDGAHHLRKHRH